MPSQTLPRPCAVLAFKPGLAFAGSALKAVLLQDGAALCKGVRTSLNWARVSPVINGPRAMLRLHVEHMDQIKPRLRRIVGQALPNTRIILGVCSGTERRIRDKDTLFLISLLYTMVTECKFQNSNPVLGSPTGRLRDENHCSWAP